MKKSVLFLSTVLFTLSRADWKFPDDFKFGVATSAYQVEGGWNASGKGISVWDYLTHSNPNFIKDKSNGDIACDTYHKYLSDIQLLKELGVNHYRFSISWTRLFPDGTINILNQDGVDYYNNLINALIENGIEPMVTLLHFDPPQILAPLGTFTNLNFIDYFEDYARMAFQLFGDRVKTWITFNEPKIVCVDYNTYTSSVRQPFPLGQIEYECAHTIVNAHARVYRLYNKEFKFKQWGKVGITLNFEWSEAASSSVEDQEAAEKRRQFEFGLFANPVIYGDYPKIVKEVVGNRSKAENFPRSRLPTFTTLQKLALRRSTDFIGLNHYSTFYVKATEDAPIDNSPSFYKDLGTEHYQDPSWPESGNEGMRTVPWGLNHALKWIKETYNDPVILITECGYSDQTGELQDPKRIDYYRGYLNATLQAILEDGVKVKAFTAWSFIDNFEWVNGYTLKFGLINVDFNDPSRPRTLKDSARYYKNVIQTREV